MDYLTALEQSKPRNSGNLPQSQILLFSHWETKTLEVFLKAHAMQLGRALAIQSSGFGSLNMDLERLAAEPAPPGAPLVLLLDDEMLLPGAALRSDSLPTRESVDSALADAGAGIDRLIGLISKFAGERPVLILPPALPAFPLLSSPAWVASSASRVRNHLKAALLELQAARPNAVAVLDPEQLWNDLAPRQLLDDRLLFTGGWPFGMDATDRLAQAICGTIFPAPEIRKLLITDADQTLWQGLVGDDGAENLRWSQEPETYRFFIYQKTLNLMMSEGVLVAVASKNSPESLQAALGRKDLVLNKAGLVSCSASWLPKSSMIQEILAQTNLLASSVVFVDDSEFELGEVKSAFPPARCIRFPENNGALREFLRELRSSFDTRVVTAEDRTRASSLQQVAAFRAEAARATSFEDYLASLEMKADMEPIEPKGSDRAFQLLNKTNQFNLSGRRFEAAEWESFLAGGDRLAYQLRFRDKNADYGIVSVLLADRQGSVTDWVLSCRVFGRTIEQFMMNRLSSDLLRNGRRAIQLLYKNTGKNHAVRSFLEKLAPDGGTDQGWTVEATQPLTTFVSGTPGA